MELNRDRLDEAIRRGDAFVADAADEPDRLAPRRIENLLQALAAYHDASAMALRMGIEARRNGDAETQAWIDKRHAALMDVLHWTESWAFNSQDVQAATGPLKPHDTLAEVVNAY